MSDPLASVIIPVEEGCDTLPGCLDAVMRQDFEKTEVIVVCGPRAAQRAALPEGSEEVRVIRQSAPCSPARLANEGLRAARGHVKVLLQPHCVPVGDDWLRGMVAPFDDETVGAVVGRCEGEPVQGAARRLIEAMDPTEGARALADRPLVGRRCDAYRASLLADMGYFSEALPGPAHAIDVSLKIVDAGYSIVEGQAAVECGAAPGRRGLGEALRTAYDYGCADALLDKSFDLHWLNAGLFSVVLVSLLLPLVGAVALPLAVVMALAIFLWGWALSVRLPLVHWEMPVAPIQGAAYVVIILWARGDWWPWLFGRTMHPAVIRQWCWVGGTAAAYLLVLCGASLRGAARACRRPGGLPYAVPVLFTGALWRLISGVGYLHGALFGGQGGE